MVMVRGMVMVMLTMVMMVMVIVIRPKKVGKREASKCTSVLR
jgi:hypothetical protein